MIWLADKPDLLKQNHPNGDLRIFERSGHDIFSDEPEHFISTLITWASSMEQAGKKEITNWKKETTALLDEQLSLIRSNKSFVRLIRSEGAVAARNYYVDFKSENPGKNLFFEASMNALGYEFLFEEKVDESIAIFELNVDEFPDSWNAYDSLGEARMKNGEREKAIALYEKSIELNPDNDNGITQLNELRQ